MPPARNLAGISRRIRDKAADKRKVSVDTIVEEVETSGFGPMLLIPALIIILPTGAIPGVPDVCNIVLALMAAQIVFGRTRPWLPKWLTSLKVSGKKVDASLEKAQPVLRKIDRWSRKRLTSLTGHVAQRMIAALIVTTSLLSVGVGVIPYVPALLALPTLFFAFGMTLRDGLFIMIGIVLLAICGAAVVSLV